MLSVVKALPCLAPKVVTVQFLQNTQWHNQPQHEEGNSKAKTVRSQVEASLCPGRDTATYKILELIHLFSLFPSYWRSTKIRVFWETLLVWRYLRGSKIQQVVSAGSPLNHSIEGLEFALLHRPHNARPVDGWMPQASQDIRTICTKIPYWQITSTNIFPQ